MVRVAAGAPITGGTEDAVGSVVDDGVAGGDVGPTVEVGEGVTCAVGISGARPASAADAGAPGG